MASSKFLGWFGGMLASWDGFTMSIPAGGGSGTASVGGVLTVNTTQAGTGNNTTETDLWSYSLPANTLNADGKGVRVTVAWSAAANGNTKTFRVYVGATVVASTSSAFNGNTFRYMGEVLRTGASSETTSFSLVGSGGNATTSNGTLAIDTTAAITIKVTGQNGTALANDIVFRSAIVELLN